MPRTKWVKSCSAQGWSEQEQPLLGPAINLCVAEFLEGWAALPGTRLPLHPVLHQLVDAVLIDDQRRAELSVLHVLLQALQNEKELTGTHHTSPALLSCSGVSLPSPCAGSLGGTAPQSSAVN